MLQPVRRRTWAKLPSNIAGTATTVSRSFRPSPSRPSVGVWGFIFRFIRKTFAPSRWCRFLGLFTELWEEGLSWFWTVTEFIAKQYGCYEKNILIGSRPSGFRHTLRKSTLPSRFGTIASTPTWPTSYRRIWPTCPARLNLCHFC